MEDFGRDVAAVRQSISSGEHDEGIKQNKQEEKMNEARKRSRFGPTMAIVIYSCCSLLPRKRKTTKMQHYKLKAP